MSADEAEVPSKKFKPDTPEDEALESAVNSITEEPDNSPVEEESQDNSERHADKSEGKRSGSSSPAQAHDETLVTEDAPTSDSGGTTKTAPSTISHGDIIAEHYNTLEEKGIKARDNSRIVYMRNFNNWIKSALLSQFVTKVKENNVDNIHVLDMGCGKGGDLFKWKDGGVKHVVFADLAETSVQQCKARYEDLKRKMVRSNRDKFLFSAEFIPADCTRLRLRDLYRDPSIKFDIVSCQFAFHYCWESLPQVECMLRNASECLKIGGYFVGTCPNSNTIMSRLRKAGGKEFGNSVYNIKFEQEYPEGSTPPLFGAKYNFRLEGVVDCPEFLVHFPTLQRLAGRWGLVPYLKQPFRSFYKDKSCDPAGEFPKLLSRMRALEAYPAAPHEKLVAPIEEYSHVSLKTDEPCVGTLSKSEWEAITLYSAFSFKKIKEPEEVVESTN